MNALIIFSREPRPGLTKTRMMPYLSPEECCSLHKSILKDLSHRIRLLEADIYICYTTPDDKYSFLNETFPYAKGFMPQDGENLELRMYNAISQVLSGGYEKCLLIGTDIPMLDASAINKSFDALDEADLVLGPTEDGGYCLIGMKNCTIAPFAHEGLEAASYCEKTMRAIEAAGLSVRLVGMYHDVDNREDLNFYRELIRSGRYDRNSNFAQFLWRHARISVIMPVLNEETMIPGIIEQLLPYQKSCEIVIVDGGSSDRTCELAEEHFRVIHSERGRARQMNLGAAETNGDILFFLHCDSILPKRFDLQIREAISRSRYGCFGVNFPSRHIFMISNTIISNFRAFVRGLPFADQGIFMERSLFEEAGGFPDQPIHEDYEFSRRLRERGFKPAKTRDRIITSARRYGSSTWSIMTTEYLMWDLRRRYRRGEPLSELAARYRDER